MPDVALRIKGTNLSKEALGSLRAELDRTIGKFNEANKASVKLGESNKKTKEETEKLKTGLGALAIGLTAVSATTTLAVRSVVNAAIHFEKLNKSALAVSGGLLEASKQMARYREVAKLPGLGLEEVARGATSLQAVKMNAIDATNTIKVFGNALATVGKGREDLFGVTLALTQMIGKGKVLAEEINQLAERVPQVRQVMVEAFGTADTEIIQTKVSAQEFIKVLVDGLSKLPTVAGGVANSIENLRDSFQQLKVNLGNALLPTISTLLDGLSGLIESFNNMGPGMKALISWSMVLTAGITALSGAVLGGALAWEKFGAGIMAVGARLLPMLLTPVGLVVAGIAALGVGIFMLTKYMEANKYTAERFADDIGKISTELDRLKKIDEISEKLEKLRAKTNRTAEENKELRDTQNELAKLAPELVQAFDDEGNAMIKAGKEVKEYTKQWRELYGVMEDIKVARAQIERDKLEDKIAKQAEVVNQTRESYDLFRQTLGLTNSETKMWLDLLEQESNKLKELQGSLSTYTKTISEYLAQFDTESMLAQNYGPRSSTKPTGKSLTDDEIALQRELQEAAASRITDEFNRERALAKLKAQQREEDLKKQYAKSTLLNAALISNEKDLQAELTKIDKAEAEKREKLQKEIQDRRNETIDKEQARYEALAERRQRLREEEAKRQEEQYQKDIEAIGDRNKREEELAIRDAESAERAKQTQADADRKTQEAIAAFKEKLLQDEIQRTAKAEEAKRREAEKTYDAYYDTEKMRIALIDKTQERVLAELELEYKMAKYYIQQALQEEEISAERKIYLAQQLYYIEQDYNKKRMDLMNQSRRELARSFGEALSQIPGGVVDILQQEWEVYQEHHEKIKDLQTETADQINEIRNDEFMTAAARAREIEKIEEESAKKRRKLEEDLQKAKREAYQDYLKSFLAGIASEIAAIYEKKAAEEITKRIEKSDTGKAIISAIAGLIGNTAVPGAGAFMGYTAGEIAGKLFGMSYDNPSNDALARWYGAKTALQGASFDEPVNDMRAKMMGTRVASYELGKRSADDMIANFQQGFMQKSRELPGTSKENYSEILREIKDAVANPGTLKIMLDGKEIHSKIQRITDKTTKRETGW